MEKLPYPLQQGEEMLAFARRHWLYLYPRLALGAAMAVVPLAALWSLLVYAERTDGWWLRGGLIASAVWALYWLQHLYFLKYRYDNDIWVVTNQRIVDSIKKNWFHLQMSTADLVDIEDMTVKRSGVLGTVFDFGEIQCQTAGAERNFALNGIPHPRQLQALIDRLRDQARSGIDKA